MNIRNFLNSLKQNIELFLFLCTAFVVIRKVTDTFEFFTGFRAFHVYWNTANCVPYVGQDMIFKREYSNKYDSFAVAAKTLLKRRIAPITVRHVPRELSQHTWYAIQEGHNLKQRFIIQTPDLLP